MNPASTSEEGKRPSRLKKSFSYHGWQRLQKLCRAQRETLEERERLQGEMEEKGGDTQRLTAQHATVESARSASLVRNEYLETSRKAVLGAKARLTKARIDHQHKLSEIASLQEQVEGTKARIEEHRSAYIAKRELLLRSSRQLGWRRRQLVEELETVYPVTGTRVDKGRRDACDCSPLLSIAGAHLPPAERFAGHNETELAVALGHVAHVVVVVSRLLDISLRFPISLLGSQSAIANLTSAGFRDSERIAILAPGGGQEAAVFDYAVYLLNRNVGQLRAELGLPTPDLRTSLANLQGLLAHIKAARIGPAMQHARGPSWTPQVPSTAHSSSETETQPEPSSSSSAPSLPSIAPSLPTHTPAASEKALLNWEPQAGALPNTSLQT